MNIKRPPLTRATREGPTGSFLTRPELQRGAERPCRARSESPRGDEARLDRAPTPRGTSPWPPSPSRQSADDPPDAFMVFVEQARSWADDVLSCREVVEQELAAWREGLEALIVLLDDVERQLERADSHGLTAGASMHLFYLSRALEQEDRPSAGTQTLEDMQSRAWQIRAALMRSASFELER